MILTACSTLMTFLKYSASKNNTLVHMKKKCTGFQASACVMRNVSSPTAGNASAFAIDRRFAGLQLFKRVPTRKKESNYRKSLFQIYIVNSVDKTKLSYSRMV